MDSLRVPFIVVSRAGIGAKDECRGWGFTLIYVSSPLFALLNCALNSLPPVPNSHLTRMAPRGQGTVLFEFAS